MSYTVEYSDTHPQSDRMILIRNEKGDVVFQWDDEANADYPEDLTWGRMIGDVFEAGYKLGRESSK